jgi:hypothetical protein
MVILILDIYHPTLLLIENTGVIRKAEKSEFFATFSD